jgi:hypothetical protein
VAEATPSSSNVEAGKEAEVDLGFEDKFEALSLHWDEEEDLDFS